MAQRLRVAGVSLSSGPALGRLRVAGVTMTGTPALRVELSTVVDPMALEPYDVVEVTAAPPAGFPTPSSYTWSTDSPDVDLVGTGNTRTFTAPRELTTTDFSVSVYGTLSGDDSPTETLDMRVLPHLHWRFNEALELVPIHRTRP